LAFSDRVLRAAPPMGGAAALPRIRAQLAELVSDPQPGDAGVAARAALRALHRPAGVVLWFGDPASQALRAVAARHSVVVVLPREPVVEALVDASPETPHRFWTALAAERFLIAARERADSLRRIGVVVVSETPARLEAAVWAAVSRGSRANRRVR
jgi:flavin reductase (DIM6/NTAB) family NADH-FMN oxidoreductase RutF